MSVFIIIFNAADAALDPVVVAGIIGGLQKTYNKKESNRPPCRFSFLQDRLVARKQKKGETLITPERFQLGKNINRLRTTKKLNPTAIGGSGSDKPPFPTADRKRSG